MRSPETGKRGRGRRSRATALSTRGRSTENRRLCLVPSSGLGVDPEACQMPVGSERLGRWERLGFLHQPVLS